MNRTALLASLLLSLPALGQDASDPNDPIVQGIPPDERVDVTGDGIPDLVITGQRDHIPDPEQGLEGWIRRIVRPLPGTSFLLRTTRNNAGYFTLGEAERLDTAALARGFHFKQLQWSAPGSGHEFRILEKPYGPGMTPEIAFWTSTGDYFDDAMVLRSTLGGRTAIASFTLRFNLPAGRIWITAREAMAVPKDFGREGGAPPPPVPAKDPYSFGDEPEPQVIIPPGLPPDELVQLDPDDVPDAIITGHVDRSGENERSGHYVRGVFPAPGCAFLMERKSDDHWSFFRLPYGEQLTPVHLASGLQSGTLKWAEDGAAFCAVLRHPFAKDGSDQGWIPAEEDVPSELVYRTMSDQRPIIGVVELSWTLPGGELSLNPQVWVNEGDVLEVR